MMSQAEILKDLRKEIEIEISVYLFDCNALAYLAKLPNTKYLLYIFIHLCFSFL